MNKKAKKFLLEWKGYIIASIIIGIFLSVNISDFKAIINHVKKPYINEQSIIKVCAEVSKKVDIEVFERNKKEVNKQLNQKIDTIYLYSFEQRLEKVLKKVMNEIEQKKELKLTQK